MNLNTARRHALRFERAQTLLCEGYELELLFGPEVPDVYYMTTPQGAHYTVDFSKAQPTCTCADFAKHQDLCKHTLAISIKRHEDSLCEEHDQMMEDSELASTGCDPFARL